MLCVRVFLLLLLYRVIVLAGVRVHVIVRCACSCYVLLFLIVDRVIVCCRCSCYCYCASLLFYVFLLLRWSVVELLLLFFVLVIRSCSLLSFGVLGSLLLCVVPVRCSCYASFVRCS